MKTPPAPKPTRKQKIEMGIPKLPGNRKQRTAAARKVEKRASITSTLKGYRSSARKVRLLADMIRRKPVEKALAYLELSKRHAARDVRKALLAALNSWEQKRGADTLDLDNVHVNTILVDVGAMFKRVRPAPQGRAYRVRKRTCRVIINLDYINAAGNAMLPQFNLDDNQ